MEDNGSGPPVVLIHNGVMDAQAWDGQVPALAERHRVVRYDCPGFGRSTPREEPYRETDVLLGLLDELGIESAALVGNSRGGRIAIDFTLAHPGRVTALVPVAAGVSGYRLSAYSDDQASREEAALEAGDWDAAADVTFEVWGSFGEDAVMRALLVANAAAELLTEQEQPPERPAIDHLEEIRAPTLVITGDHDVPAMSELGDLLERRIPGARRLRFDGSDHFPSMREPNRFNHAVLDFLDEAERATSGV
jgi:3-oxoadipate enol-lactonase